MVDGISSAGDEDQQCSDPLLSPGGGKNTFHNNQFDVRIFPTPVSESSSPRVDVELQDGEDCTDLKETSNGTKPKEDRKRDTLLAEECQEWPEDTEDEEEDPWALLEMDTSNSKMWSEMTLKERLHRVFITFLLKPISVLFFLYFFICSLDLMSSSFRLLGGREAGEVLGENELLNNPVCGLMLGILATVLVQSSSTSTSIVVSIVSAGLLNVQQAIYIIMGANIGTSVTNTIVSLAQVGKKNEFRRAFGAATVHDMFNWLGVLILLPVEVFTGYLYRTTSVILKSMNVKSNEEVKIELLKKLTKPLTSRIIQIDRNIITLIAVSEIDSSDKSLLKIWCKKEKIHSIVNGTQEILYRSGNATQLATEIVPVTQIEEVGIEKCNHLFVNTNLSERAVGGILLLASLVMLCLCLIFLVKILHSLMKGRIAFVIRKTINADFPGCLRHLTGYVAILVGAGITFLVQSSSVFTSAMTPLVGVGVITLERMYPLTLGSNIGTTATGLLAALASSEGHLKEAIQIALCHLLFNITAITIWFPVTFMRKVPIYLAKTLGNTTADYRRSQYLAEKKAKFITQEISDMDFLAVISTVVGTDGYVDMQDIFPYTMLGEVVRS
ncbi:putative sodium-dependent phosphate transport protein 2C isoform X2 [Apostichopus japonicus]|uniref:Putative sodium-dependent phosphate transport protein 2C isoform X2 n=1 Tax=Stichopus japonicus TaxID=307972 RepID=A0A2G8KEQ1_STIJA|nr:putative sodium-dependent phosphate transport protein 2C isoform X2 [Apostichopus japonicus]